MFLCAAFCLAYAPIQEMSLEEKVGQLLMVHFYGEEANAEAKALIQETQVGGIIYYNWSNALTSPSQVGSLSCGLQALAQETCLQIPLLIAVDQEGGPVARLRNGFTQFPSQRVVGMTGDPEVAESIAWVVGEELRAVGINMNLTPVVDVSIPDSVMQERSFGSDPESVASFGKAALRGYQRACILATLKHFPGYGSVKNDPHYAEAVVSKSMEELRGDLLPFKELASCADAIMVAHTRVAALDPDNCSTLSKKTLDYLKEEVGFKGLIVSDSLVMKSVLQSSLADVAIQAFNAGCDLLLLGGKVDDQEEDIPRVHQALVEAVKNGTISEERLDASVKKILTTKERYARRGG